MLNKPPPQRQVCALDVTLLTCACRPCLCVLLLLLCCVLLLLLPLTCTGFTHLQQAQTVRWGHWLMSHAAAWQRDDMRLRDLLPRVATLPLGSGGVLLLMGLWC